MKIVIVNTHMADHLGGSQVQCDVIAEGLHARGYDVTYLAVDKKTDYSTNYRYRVEGVKRGSSSISSKIVAMKPDIVYWRFNKRYFYKCVKQISKIGAKIIFAVSNVKDLQPYSEPWPKRFTLSAIRNFIIRNLLSRYNHIGFNYVDGITVNNEEHLPLSPVLKSKYVPNAISDKRVDFSWKKPFVLWVANIKKRKRPEIFVKLAGRFESGDVDFLMVGNISDNKYEWIARRDDLPSNFHYLGPKSFNEVNGILAASHFLITTSTPEGFSNNMIQAWLQGKPVIAYEFDPGGKIEKHQLGYVAHSSFETLVEKTCLLLENESLRSLAGEKAEIFANNYFSVEKTISELEEMIMDLSGKTQF